MRQMEADKQGHRFLGLLATKEKGKRTHGQYGAPANRDLIICVKGKRQCA